MTAAAICIAILLAAQIPVGSVIGRAIHNADREG